jgi:cysteine desulfurase
MKSQLGGEQETKRRAGTENLAQIVGLTKALELAHKNRELIRHLHL